MNSSNELISLDCISQSWLLCLARVAYAQTAEKKTLTLQGAERVIAAAKAEAQKVQAPGGVIAVVDDGGNLMALERLDGTFSAGANISIGKARPPSCSRSRRDVFEELINSSGKGRTVMTALLENFTPLIGGIPIIVDGQIVGGVGVSGAASADQDEQLAIAGSKAFDTGAMSMREIPARSVLLGKKKVDEAFAKGAVLFDGSDGRNYMVHASRREKPGQAKIHTKDTDIIYVLQGFGHSRHRWRSGRRKDHCSRRDSRQQHPRGQTRQTRPGRRRSSCPTECRTSSWKSPIRSSTTS